jgi:hypothetical protein
LSEYGTFCYLISEVEARQYLDLTVEFSERVRIQGKREVVNLLHSCLTVNDAFSVSLFVSEGILDSDTEQHFLKNYRGERVVKICDY